MYGDVFWDIQCSNWQNEALICQKYSHFDNRSINLALLLIGTSLSSKFSKGKRNKIRLQLNKSSDKNKEEDAPYSILLALGFGV